VSNERARLQEEGAGQQEQDRWGCELGGGVEGNRGRGRVCVHLTAVGLLVSSEKARLQEEGAGQQEQGR
jgi:hypothetical protein